MVNERAVEGLRKMSRSVGKALKIGFVETGKTLVAGLSDSPPRARPVRNNDTKFLPKNVRRYYK